MYKSDARKTTLARRSGILKRRASVVFASIKRQHLRTEGDRVTEGCVHVRSICAMPSAPSRARARSMNIAQTNPVFIRSEFSQYVRRPRAHGCAARALLTTLHSSFVLIVYSACDALARTAA